jgi:uracil-DNA glycosylase
MSNLRLNLDEWLAEDWKNIVLEAGWGTHLDELSNFLNEEYPQKKIFPSFEHIFNAYNACSFQDTRVVILGQDPYHQINQANGLCFSVPEGVAFPPSLKNINKELQADLGVSLASGDLMHWAGQGVLLINSILTVEDSLPGSHANIGWLSFTKLILSELNLRKSGLVFMLWGNYAQKLGKDLDLKRHHIIKTSHPSPLSANRGGWFGTRPFSQANSYLDVPILWA